MIMPEYIPRDIYEVAELFEDLLFMRTGKFSEPDPQEKPFVLNKDGIELLGRLGIAGRIFRRWYQTTWGWDNPSKCFAGETPRMELARYHKGLVDGSAYVGLQLVKSESKGAKIVPSIYEEEIQSAGGVFPMGLGFLPSTTEARRNFNQLPPPNFDPEFKNFASLIEVIGSEIEREEIEELPQNVEERAWQIFWPNVCMEILLNCELKIPHDALIAASSVFRSIVEYAIKEEGNSPDDYVDFTRLFDALWNFFRELDPRLLPIEEVATQDHQKTTKLMNRTNGPRSLKVFYNLGNLLDELLLFPADRYFGAVECVWTDKMNFLQDLATSAYLLNHDLKMSYPKKLNKEQKKFWATGIEQKATDIYRIWFSPPTCFRILPRFLKYFKKS